MSPPRTSRCCTFVPDTPLLLIGGRAGEGPGHDAVWLGCRARTPVGPCGQRGPTSGMRRGMNEFCHRAKAPSTGPFRRLVSGFRGQRSCGENVGPRDEQAQTPRVRYLVPLPSRSCLSVPRFAPTALRTRPETIGAASLLMPRASRSALLVSRVLPRTSSNS